MELRFKILVLRVLMMILHKLVTPVSGKDKNDGREVDRLAVDVHVFIRQMDELSRQKAAPVSFPSDGKPEPSEANLTTVE